MKKEDENNECKKKKYHTQFSALCAIVDCQRLGRSERRYYFCEQCRCYHLTSKGRNVIKFNKSDENKM